MRIIVSCRTKKFADDLRAKAANQHAVRTDSTNLTYLAHTINSLCTYIGKNIMTTITTLLSNNHEAILEFGKNFVNNQHSLSTHASNFILQEYVNPIYGASRSQSLLPHVTQCILPRLLSAADVTTHLLPNIGDHMISEKTDGVRAWLLILASSFDHNDTSPHVFMFINRKGNVWYVPPHLLCFHQSSPTGKTATSRLKMLLFDGELVVNDNNVAYVIFDLLAVNFGSQITQNCQSFLTRIHMCQSILDKTMLTWNNNNDMAGHLHVIYCKEWQTLTKWANTPLLLHTKSDGWIILHKSTKPFIIANTSTAITTNHATAARKLKSSNTVDLWMLYDSSMYVNDWFSLTYATNDQNIRNSKINMCGFGMTITSNHNNRIYVLYNVVSLYDGHNATSTENMSLFVQQQVSSPVFTAHHKLIVEFRIVGRLPDEGLAMHCEACSSCKLHFGNTRTIGGAYYQQRELIFLEIEPVYVRTDKSAANNTHVIVDTIDECLNPTMDENKLRNMILSM